MMVKYFWDIFQFCLKNIEDGHYYNVNLTVVYPTDTKPMIGGFIDQRTKITYHHAFTSMEVTAKPMRKTRIFFGKLFKHFARIF